MWYCCYSVVKNGTTDLVRSNNTACFAEYVNRLSNVTRVVVHIAMSVPENGKYQTTYSNAQIVRYLRALQRAGLKFKFSGNQQLNKRKLDYYNKPIPPNAMEPDVKCYNIDIDLTTCSQINAQLVMFCSRFLYERAEIAAAFLRFLDDDLKAKKKSGVHIFDKMLIAMLLAPGSGHSFGANAGYNLLLGKDGFKKYITDSKSIDTITSSQLPKTTKGEAVFVTTCPIRKKLVHDIRNATLPISEIAKIYEKECARYM